MNGHSHRVLGAATVLVTLPHLPVHGPIPQAVTVLVAVASSSGRLLSPDADQGWLWHLIDGWLPDEAILDDNGPMQHRGITHFWLWPVLAYLLAKAPIALILGVSRGAEVHVTHCSPAPLFAGLACGWGSHLLGDFLVGAAGQGRAAGIPAGPWFWWIGTGAKCGGVIEWAVTGMAFPVAAWLVGAHLGLYGYPHPLGWVTALR